VLTILIVAIFVSFYLASYNVDPDGKWESKSHGFFAGLDTVIRTNGTVVAALVATLGVVWSWFYQMSYGRSASRDAERAPKEYGGTESGATTSDPLNPRA
jgi:hypothetical protein